MTQHSMDLESLRASTRAVITRSEAAAILEVDARTVSRGIEEGAIPSIKVGRRIVIPREKFLQLFQTDAA